MLEVVKSDCDGTVTDTGNAAREPKEQHNELKTEAGKSHEENKVALEEYNILPSVHLQ